MEQKKLPFVDLCPNALEIWSERDMTNEELIKFVEKYGKCQLKTKDKLIEKLDTPLKLAEFSLKHIGDNRIDRFIDDVLEKSKEYKIMKKNMPSKTPKALQDYQESYPNYNKKEVDKEIRKINALLADGQYIFHGGKWFDDKKNELVTTKPFSTTLSPQIAVNEALHNGKAYDNNGIDLFVLKVKNPKTPVFVYKNKETNLGYEKEILFASKARLTLKSKKIIENKEVYKFTNSLQELYKEVPVRLLEVEIE